MLTTLLFLLSAHAAPTRTEAYRSDRLQVVVYKDGQDPEVLWYLPPLKMYESEGKVVHYRRAKDGKVNYYFYIVPYMTNELIDLLAGEIPGLRDKTQLKPVLAKQFGIQVKQFGVGVLGDKVTDYQYLNQPQLIQLTLDASQAEEFDFFLTNKPGVQANVLFHFDAEKADKYLTIELSHREIYDALNIGGSGKYSFTKAEIEAGVANYLSKKYMSVRSKGDFPMPEIVTRVIEECFTPYNKPVKKDKNRRWDDWEDIWNQNVELLSEIEPDKPETPGTGGDAALTFTFKKELASSDRSFFYKQEHYVDSSEIASVPLYLSTAPQAASARLKVTPLATRDFVVDHAHENANKPFASGVAVGPDEQVVISAVFAYSAHSPYKAGLSWYRWASDWPGVDEDLYYRVGNGPWQAVSGRAVLKTEGIYRGELQFYLDREKIWSKIPAKYKDPKMLGAVPAIFAYGKTYPQFNVVVTGRKVEF